MRTARTLLALVLLLPQAASGQGSDRSRSQAGQLVASAIAQTRTRVTYDGSYRRIAYPAGDVPQTIGVCTDLVIRAFRGIGVDLQVEVHEDMKRAFAFYPRIWGLSRPDPNIDHRRVPNLQTFFQRAGAELPALRTPDAYQPGDLVTWMLAGNLPHIGMVAIETSTAGTPLIVHNIGRGPEVQDMLFSYRITGHYRYRTR